MQFTCNTSMDAATAKKIVSLLNQILQKEGNATNPTEEINHKLDEILGFVRSQQQRHLSVQQITAIKSSAQSLCAILPLINITAPNGDQEAQRYAYDFVEALRGGGCKSDLVLPIPGLTPDVSGIHIAVRDFNNIDPSAKALGKILSGAGLSFSVNPMKPDFFPAEVFVLVIGAKSE